MVVLHGIKYRIIIYFWVSATEQVSTLMISEVPVKTVTA